MAEKKPEIEGPDSFIGTIVFFVGLAGVICLGGWILRFFGTAYGIFGVFLLITAVLLNGLKVVPEPEIWIIERFGKYNRKLKPGLGWVVPFIETVRAKLKLYEQPIEMLRSKEQIIFRDGPATLLNPRLFFELREDRTEDAIYKVEDYEVWVEKVLGPIVRGYLNTLAIDEALDEGAARGDILNKMRGRPDITKTQIKHIKSFIREISKKINELKKTNKDTSLLEATKKSKEDEKKEKEICLVNQEKLKAELTEFEQQAQERGFEKIHRAVVGEFIISDALKTARETIHQARKDAISAVSRAIAEATMRTEPIVRAKTRFEQIGFSEKEARENAFLIELVETLATNRSLFLTSAGKGDLQSLAAQLTAIFSETRQRREGT